MRYKTILFIGPPGSGKGTQAELLRKISNLLPVSTGAVFRSLDPLTELGRLYSEISRTGSLMTDSLTLEILESHIARLISSQQFDPKRQILLLDGVPRTQEQARLINQQFDVLSICLFEIEHSEALIERMAKRALMEGRVDDHQEIFLKRLEIYQQQLKSLLDSYSKEIIHSIDAKQKPLAVLKDLLSILDPIIESN